MPLLLLQTQLYRINRRQLHSAGAKKNAESCKSFSSRKYHMWFTSVHPRVTVRNMFSNIQARQASQVHKVQLFLRCSKSTRVYDA
jgi:hypothetical protein